MEQSLRNISVSESQEAHFLRAIGIKGRVIRKMAPEKIKSHPYWVMRHPKGFTS
jgi:hypothetical protein